MATRRRPSEPHEPTPRGWTVARRVALPQAANDNRLPASVRAMRIVALAAALAACVWVVVEIL